MPKRKLGGVTAAGEAAAAEADVLGLTPRFGETGLVDDAIVFEDALEAAGLKAKAAEVAWLFEKRLAGTAVWGKPVVVLAVPAGKGASEGCAEVA